MPRKRGKQVSFMTSESYFGYEQVSSSATDISESSLKTSSQSEADLLHNMENNGQSLEIDKRGLETLENDRILKDFLLRKGEIRGRLDEEDTNSDDVDNEHLDDDSCGKYKITKSDMITFLCLVVSTFISWLAFSIMAPFFPNEAHRRGLKDIEVAVIFSLQALTSTIISPIVGKFLPMIGAKVTLVSGLFLEAAGNVLFGYCVKLHSTTAFIAFAYITRIMVGLGVGTSVTATMTINANTFPNHIARTVGLLETTAGLGLLLGPLFGGLLYQIGKSSYLLPFVVIGGLDMGSMLFSLYFLPSQKCKAEESGSVSELLRIPWVWPIAMAAFLGSATLGFLEPTFSVHATNFTDNAFYIGLLFMLVSGSYAGSSPLWGWIGDTFAMTRVCLIVGLLLDSFAFLLIGPSPLLHLPSRLWIICIGLMLYGIGDGAVIVSSIGDMFSLAVQYDLPEDIRTYSVVSGVFNCAYSLGTVFGPWVAGGLLYQEYGFNNTSQIMSLVLLAMAFVVCVSSVAEHHWRKRQKRLGKDVKDSYNIQTDNAIPETVPLFQQPKGKKTPPES
nr:MFS-type transporter SLC18B1-like [Lytechinus pictus]